MRISPPTVQRNANSIRLSARVQTAASIAGLPETLWFEYPASQEALLSSESGGFVVSLLLPAMALSEEIEVCGPLSPYLVRSMDEYQMVFHAFFPNWLRPIRVFGAGVDAGCEESAAPGVATTFSGGVDSFYTLYSHLPENEPLSDYRLTHTLFIQGFDIPLEDQTTFTVAAQAYASMMQSLGLQLLTVRTNVRQWVDRILAWEVAHGAALIGCAMTLKRAFSRLYIPGTQPYTEAIFWGSDYRADPLLSTRSLQIVHDGASKNRMEKILTIAHWPETFGRLRVCWKKPDGLINCCRRNKCLRTMAALELTGALPLQTSFPLPLERKYLRACRCPVAELYILSGIIAQANAVNRQDIAADVRYSLQMSRLHILAGQTLRRLGLRR